VEMCLLVKMHGGDHREARQQSNESAVKAVGSAAARRE
jgi:hypothetical protein